MRCKIVTFFSIERSFEPAAEILENQVEHRALIYFSYTFQSVHFFFPLFVRTWRETRLSPHDSFISNIPIIESLIKTL